MIDRLPVDMDDHTFDLAYHCFAAICESHTTTEGQDRLPNISLFFVNFLANVTFNSFSLTKHFYPLSKHFLF